MADFSQSGSQALMLAAFIACTEPGNEARFFNAANKQEWSNMVQVEVTFRLTVHASEGQ